MPMQAESLEVLEKASVAAAQARAIVRAIEIEIAGAKDSLATKHDIEMLRQGMDALRAEIRGELKDLRAELRVEFRTELAKQGGDLRAEIAGVTRQVYIALFGQTAVLLGFFYFFLVQVR
jgi:hypothetical protein